MPGGDRTGPAGAGPMTGRGMGFCAGYQTAGYATAFGRRGGVGFSRGGRGWRNMYYATGLPGWVREARPGAYAYPPYPYPQTLSREEELENLQAHSKHLEDVLVEMKERIARLEAEKSEKKK